MGFALLFLDRAMPTSSRFAVAVQVLAALALAEGRPLTSELLAGSVRTNPAVIRRLLSQLGRAGITTSQLGQGGGALLARAPKAISLLDVYRAVEDETLFGEPRQEPNAACVVGCHIRSVLRAKMGRAQAALERELARETIAGVAREIAALEKSPK